MLKLWGVGAVLAIGLSLCPHGAAFAADAGKTIQIITKDGNFVFSEPDAKIEAGQSITWEAVDPGVPHLLVPDDAAHDAFTPTKKFKKPEKVTQKFDKPGVINYHCQIHPTTLKGKITVEKPK